jgi:glutaredoxin
MTDAPTEIIMYARERFCPDVTRARLRLTDLGLTWTEFDVEADPAARDAAFKASGRSNVPTLVIGDQVLVEPSNAELDRALVAAGFDVSED